MLARVSDATNNDASIIVVEGSTTNMTTYATMVSQLQSIYETIVASGKWVVALTIPPRTSLTAAQQLLLLRINNWIRAYCNQESWANPSGYKQVLLADPSIYLTDTSNTSSVQPIGGSSGLNPCVTTDGIGISNRGAQLIGFSIYEAIKRLLSNSVSVPPRMYSMADGYDSSVNPRGNMVEGIAWTSNTAYTAGQIRSNNTNIYRCVTSGTSANSGGPTSNTGTITDGTAQWTFQRPQGLSVGYVANGGTQTAYSGITYSGSFPASTSMSRTNGSANGTITGALEIPRTDLIPGQRYTLSFSLSGGTTSEIWRFFLINAASYNTLGLTSSDLGNTYIYTEAEIDVSNTAYLNGLYLSLIDNSGSGLVSQTGNFNATGSSTYIIPPTGDTINWPNGSKMFFRGPPTLLPNNMTTLQLVLYIGFDTSIGTATGTFKINNFGIRKAYTA
jgi:hypothetical protein